MYQTNTNKMNISGIILGIGINLGSIISYIPQFHAIVKHKSVEGISEASLIIANMGMMCLTMNSLIFSWESFFCLGSLKTQECLSNLTPFITITISWLMVLIYYIIFIIYKFRDAEKRLLSGLNYVFTYLLVLLLVISLALGEKMQGNNKFFTIYANVLGIASAIFNGLVYIPQIYLLIKNKSSKNLSLVTYLIQTQETLLISSFKLYYIEHLFLLG